MKDWKSWIKRCFTEEEMQRHLKFAAIPFAAAMLILVILATDKPRTGEEPAISQKALAQEETLEKGAGDSQAASEELAVQVPRLEKDAVPEVRALAEAYFKAKLDCDAGALNDVFGGTWSQEKLSKEQAALNDGIGYYEAFQNLSCYTAPGLSPGEYVAYACYDIKFRKADTPAPTIMAFYVKKKPDGRYYIEEKATGAAAEHMGKVNQSREVQLLVSQVNGSLRDALEDDDNLLAIYDSLVDAKE